MNAAAVSLGGVPAHGARQGSLDAAQRAGFFALTAGVFFAPYLTWRPLQSIMFTLGDALFCVAAALLVRSGRISRRPLGAFTPWLLLAYAMMMTGLLAGSLVNGEPLRWAVAAAQYGFALIVLPFLLVGHGQAMTVRFGKALIIGMVAMELFGMAIYFGFDGNYEDNVRFGLDFISGSGRLGTFVGDANWNGAISAMTLPFVIYLHARRQIGNWSASIAAAVLVAALVLAASVTALACTVASTAVMIVIGGQRIPKGLLLAGAAASAMYFGAGGPLPRAFESRVVPALSSGNLTEAGTFQGRLDLIEEAWGIVGDTMIIGLGVDQFREVSVQRAPVHNMYLLLWTEGGLLALFGWVLILVVLVLTILQVARKDRLTAALGLATMTTLIVSSAASPHMYARLWLVPVFLAIAFAFDCAVIQRKGAR